MSEVSSGSSLLEKVNVIAFEKCIYSFQDPANKASIQKERELSMHDPFRADRKPLSRAVFF